MTREPIAGDAWQRKAEFRNPFDPPDSDGGERKVSVLDVKDGWIKYRGPRGGAVTATLDHFVSVYEFHHAEMQSRSAQEFHPGIFWKWFKQYLMS